MRLEKRIRAANQEQPEDKQYKFTETNIEGRYAITYPVYYADGDGVSIFVQELSDDRLLLSDSGTLSMRLSFTRDLGEADYNWIISMLSGRQTLSTNGILHSAFPIGMFKEELDLFANVMIGISEKFQ